MSLFKNDCALGRGHLTYDELIAIRLEKQMREELRQLAKRLMVSESALVRQGVLHVLHRNGIELANRRTWHWA